MVFVDGLHEGACGRQDVLNKEEDGLVGLQLDVTPHFKEELAHRRVVGNKELALGNVGRSRVLCFLHNNRNKVRIALLDLIGNFLTLFC